VPGGAEDLDDGGFGGTLASKSNHGGTTASPLLGSLSLSSEMHLCKRVRVWILERAA
jgi:hypothetical protein